MNALIRPVFLVPVMALLIAYIFGFRFACDLAGFQILTKESLLGKQLPQLKRGISRHLDVKEYMSS
jgi:hypothetical protein